MELIFQVLQEESVQLTDMPEVQELANAEAISREMVCIYESS